MTKSIVLAALLISLSTLAHASPEEEAVADAMKAADRYRGVLEIKVDDAASASDDLGKHGLEYAQACSNAVDRMIAGGANAKTEILVDGYKKVVLATVKPEHCDKLAALAKDFDAKAKAAKQARADKVAAPFKAAGLTGDKLAFAIRVTENDYDIYGAGGTILKPAALKAAAVLFILTGDRDHDWVLHRYAFKGDAQVSQTEQTFIVRPAPSKFR
jgi:hypothetical protein